MGIKLSTTDQILLLRSTAGNILQLIADMDKVEFDRDLMSYAGDLSRVTDTVNDASVFSLKTNDEIDEEVEELRQEAGYRAEAGTIYNENRI